MKVIFLLVVLFALVAFAAPLVKLDSKALRTDADSEVGACSQNPCGSGETCCTTASGPGCCPSAGACCCPDQQHCCQSGYQCQCTGCPGSNCQCTGCVASGGSCS